jgi:hypothetical protein
MTIPEQSSSAEPGDEAGTPSGMPHDAPEPSIDDLDFPPLAGRPRVIRAELARSQGWKSAVEIVLERGDRRAEVKKDAIGEEVVLFRCAAECTIEAINELLAGPPRFALVGAKRVLAFDSAVILACVRIFGGSPRKLIGCVPITEDPVLAVARAVLHATNRIVEALPNPLESAEEESATDAEPSGGERSPAEREPGEDDDHESDGAHDESDPAGGAESADEDDDG